MNWIVFDYGEVISTRTTALPSMAAALGVQQAAFEPRYWAHRDRYDRGCTDLEYWRAVGDDLGLAVDQSTSDTLTALDVEGWSHTSPESVELLAALAEAGASLALLSNAPSSFARFAERQDWAGHFRVRLFSGDVGIAKPDPEIFRTLVSRLGAEPADCLFFDDRQSNIDGARAAGLRAHRWLGVSTAEAALG
ncbi:HAD-IA family hydrolase [Amycolatopsis nigrescens]|uniref:HAD-IA family hydrolase n=1 Tax=Amycolatopsis nigrescens TaxID=381445 RepID=UPI000365D471|nr:HAD-IA family hydrolase [Amycolatopsis nigrescens]